MFNLKKTAAALLAAVCMTGAVMPIVPGAAAEATYDQADVNRDGSVNLLDSIIITKYLSGLTTTDDYARLDANGNHIVDREDVHCVLSKAVKLSYSAAFYSKTADNTMPVPSISGTVLYPSSFEPSRTYRKYNLLTGEQSTYTLSLSSTDAFNDVGASTYSMVDGIDTRHLTSENDIENNGIVFIKTNLLTPYNTVSTEGTGFIVGDHIIATAAHCVYSNDYTRWHYNFKLYTYTKEGEKSEVSLTPVEVHFPDIYTKAVGGSKADYALITVKEDLSDYFHFTLGETYNLTYNNFKNVPLYITGVPGVVKIPAFSENNGIENKEHLIYTDEGRLVDVDKSNQLYHDNLVFTSTYSSGGDSGAPIYTITKIKTGNDESYIYTVIGIETNGSGYNYSFGPRMTKPLIYFYTNNPNISYT